MVGVGFRAGIVARISFSIELHTHARFYVHALCSFLGVTIRERGGVKVKSPFARASPDRDPGTIDLSPEIYPENEISGLPWLRPSCIQLIEPVNLISIVLPAFSFLKISSQEFENYARFDDAVKDRAE